VSKKKKKIKKEKPIAEGLVGWLSFSYDSEFPTMLHTEDKNYEVNHPALKVMVLSKDAIINGNSIHYKGE